MKYEDNGYDEIDKLLEIKHEVFIGRVARLYRHEYVVIALRNKTKGKVKVYLNEEQYSLACKCHLYWNRLVIFKGWRNGNEVVELEYFREATQEEIKEHTKIKDNTNG